MWQKFTEGIVLNFIKDNRWRYLTNGLGVTLKITFFAVLLGLVIGFVVSMVRSAHESTGKLKLLNAICGLYLTVIRGTPVVVQLLLIYFGVFGSVRVDKTLWRSSRSASIPARTRRRYSARAFSRFPADSLRRVEVSALTMFRP